MKPKNLPLFYAAITTSLVGLWLFAFTLFLLGRESSEVHGAHGANIGAGMLGLLSWLFGLISFIVFVLSYCTKPKSR